MIDADYNPLGEFVYEQMCNVFQKKKFMPISKSLYHYTTLDALVNGIVQQYPKKGQELILWASNSKFFNDPKEIKYGTDLATNILNKILNHKIIPQDDIHKLNKDYYITSFSLEEDCLPMWSMYGHNGNGIALEFDTSILYNGMKRLFPCFYNRKDITYVFLEIIDKIFHNKSLFNDPIKVMFGIGVMYGYMRTLIKNHSYEYEHEIRFVSPPHDATLYFRTKNNLIIPHININIPKQALRSIIIGPSQDRKRSEYSLRVFLDSNGLDNIKIKHSKIPYRE